MAPPVENVRPHRLRPRPSTVTPCAMTESSSCHLSSVPPSSPFPLVAFGILWINSGIALSVFARVIKPQLTAMLRGSAYLGSVVFFAFLLGSRS